MAAAAARFSRRAAALALRTQLPTAVVAARAPAAALVRPRRCDDCLVRSVDADTELHPTIWGSPVFQLPRAAAVSPAVHRAFATTPAARTLRRLSCHYRQTAICLADAHRMQSFTHGLMQRPRRPRS